MASTKHRQRSPLPGSTGSGSGAIRVACLTRISTDEINQPYSLDAQAVGLDAFVASQPGYVITHRFVDQASGATLERPGLQAALAAARASEFDVLLVYRIDRLSRSITGLMEIVADLDRFGVALRSATEPIDTQGPVGRMLLQLLGIFAEFERGVLIDRITKGFERKAARGEWLSGRAPYGYRLDSVAKSLLPNEVEATVVRAIYTAYADDHLGAKAIAVRFNEAGKRSRYERLWTNQTILRVIRNPVYIGKIAHGDDVHDGKHEPIVDTDLFDRAQSLLAHRAAQATKIPSTLSTYALGGKTVCVVCHGAYVGAGAGNGRRFYRYYACRKQQVSGRHGCGNLRVPADPLEDKVLAQLLDIMSDYDFFEEAARAALEEFANERPMLAAEKASTDVQLAEVTRSLNGYLYAFENKTMPTAACAPRVEELSTRREELEAHSKHLGEMLKHSIPRIPTREEVAALRAGVADVIAYGKPALKKELFDDLLVDVQIHPGQNAYPRFKVPDVDHPGPFVAKTLNTTKVSSEYQIVEVSGLEPPTSTLRTWRSTS